MRFCCFHLRTNSSKNGHSTFNTFSLLINTPSKPIHHVEIYQTFPLSPSEEKNIFFLPLAYKSQFLCKFADNKRIDFHAEFIPVFSYHRPDADFLRRPADDTAFTHHHGTAAHSAYHRHGAGGCRRGTIRTGHTGARRLV